MWQLTERFQGAKNSKAEAPEKGPTGKPKRKPEQPKKVKQRDQKFLPVPKTVFGQNGDDSDDMDEDDLGVEEGMDFAQAGFLKGLDRNALSR
jgi:nucleolar complex protein 3